MSRPRVLAFDVDGVLVDTDRLHFDALNHALTLCRAMPLSWDEHLATWKGLPTRVKLNRLVAEGRLDARKVDNVAAIKQTATREALATLPQDETKRALCTSLLAEDFRLCAVSNALRASVGQMLQVVGVLPYMDCYFGNEDAAPKPAPDLYLLAAQRMGVRPDELTVIEDGAPGIAAATAAGCRVLTVSGPEEVTVEALWPRLVEVEWQ